MANATSDFFIRLNWLIKPLIKSPFHWLLSSRVALMRFTGRKSGNTFETPVGFHRFGPDIIVALTELENRHWWKNYREPWPMALLIKGKWRQGTAVLLQADGPEYKAWFEKMFNRDPFLQKIFKIQGYDKAIGLTAEQLAFLADTSGLVKFDQHA